MLSNAEAKVVLTIREIVEKNQLHGSGVIVICMDDADGTSEATPRCLTVP